MSNLPIPPAPKLTRQRYIASPTDRTRHEAIAASKRVSFDRDPSNLNRDGIDRDVADCFRQTKFGR